MEEVQDSHYEENISRRAFLATSLGLATLSMLPIRSANAAVAPLKTPKLAPLIRSVDTNKKMVAFTFDDGPWPKFTKAIMNHFADFDLEGQATFFQIGNNIKQYRSIAQQVAARGYDIGNHSMTHQYNPYTIAREIEPTQELIYDLGVETNLFRSPGLTEGYAIQKKLGRLGMVNVFTDYDVGDWKAPRYSTKKVARRANKSLHPGSIVLLHDGGDHQNTVKAVPYMLENALNKGYQVVQLSELLSSGGPR